MRARPISEGGRGSNSDGGAGGGAGDAVFWVGSEE